MPPRPSYTIESSFTGIVAGVDEAGCGPWAGPVVAAAVILNPHRRTTHINDSKKLTREDREELYKTIIERAHTATGMATVEEIDAINILEAAKLAMQRAFEGLSIMPDVALVDGNRQPKLPCPVKMIIGGDESCMSIAAASIIAKVTRDHIMRELAAEFPYYGWHTNAGYGTASHQNGLKEYGVTPHHRRSFAPIRALLEAVEVA